MMWYVCKVTCAVHKYVALACRSRLSTNQPKRNGYFNACLRRTQQHDTHYLINTYAAVHFVIYMRTPLFVAHI